MINKLVVIINSLKVPKIKKILLYEMKFLVPNYSCLQNPWLGGNCPQIPVLSVLNWICWTPPPPNKIPGYATASTWILLPKKNLNYKLHYRFQMTFSLEYRISTLNSGIHIAHGLEILTMPTSVQCTAWTHCTMT